MRRIYLPLLLAILTCAVSLPAYAITAKDLVGKRYAILYIGNVADDGLGVDYDSGEIVQGASENQIILKNFHDGFDIPMTVSNNRLSISNNVSLGAGTWSGQSWKNLTIKKAARYSYDDDVETGYLNGIKTTQWYYGYRNVSGDIISNPCTFDPEVRCDYFKFNDPFAAVFTYLNGGQDFLLYGRMDLFVYDTNATAKAYNGTKVVGDYPVRLTYDTDEDGDIMEILNWFDRGVGYENSVSDHTTYINIPVANIYEDGTLDIPVIPIGGEIESGGMWAQGYYSDYFAVTNTQCNAYGHYSSDRDSKGTRVQGTWTEGGVRHKLDNDFWLTHGGMQRTLEDPRSYTFLKPAVLQSGTKDVLESCDKVVITEDEPRDVTHELTLSLNTCYKFDLDGERYFYAEGSVNPGENTKYVDRYELCMVPGFHSSIAGLAQHPETGLAGATVIPDEYFIEKNTSSAYGEPALDFKVRVPASAFNAVDDNDRYSYFVKIHYRQSGASASSAAAPQAAPAYGDLFPSFGALAQKEIPTSVDSLVAVGVKVSAAPGCIIVDGAEGSAVAVYNLAGIKVYEGGSQRIAVVPGVYMVKINNDIIKIIVK